MSFFQWRLGVDFNFLKKGMLFQSWWCSWYSCKISTAPVKLDFGFHNALVIGYLTHLTRYSYPLPHLLCFRTCSTSYASSPSSISGSWYIPFDLTILSLSFPTPTPLTSYLTYLQHFLLLTYPFNNLFSQPLFLSLPFLWHITILSPLTSILSTNLVSLFQTPYQK